MVTELKLSELAEQERTDLAQFTTDPKTLTTLATDTRRSVRRYVADNPNTPVDVLTVLATDETDYVRGAVAENPNAPTDILTVLATDTDSYVRWNAAANFNTPKNTLTALATDADKAVREHAANNPNTATDTLTVLASDTDKYVRRRVAGNRNTPTKTLTVLAADTDAGVRWDMTYNSAASNELLWCMLTDTYKETVNIATKRLQSQNLSLTDPTWIDPETLKTIYDILQTNNCLNTSILIQLLKAKIALTQSELIDLCELYDDNIHELIKTNYEITHPLLKQILSPKHTLPSTISR